MSQQIWKILDRIATLLASVMLQSNTYSLADRLSNALSVEAVIKAVYEAYRSFDTLERHQIIIKTDDGVKVFAEDGERKEYLVRGWLPSALDIEKFIEAAKKDPTIARDLATLAMSKVVDARMGW